MIHPHGFTDVLELARLQPEDVDREFVFNDAIDDFRDANPARPGFRLHAGGDIHTVPHHIAAAHEHVTKMNSNPMKKRFGARFRRLLGKMSLRL
jgi:hypothetical protein